MSKIDLTKKYTQEEYMLRLNELGIKHISQEKSPHEMYYCGYCKHASLEHGSGELDGWLLQSCCSRRDMTPVSEFSWCDRFIIDGDSEYWDNYPKEKRELLNLIVDERALIGWEAEELIPFLNKITEASNE